MQKFTLWCQAQHWLVWARRPCGQHFLCMSCTLLAFKPSAREARHSRSTFLSLWDIYFALIKWAWWVGETLFRNVATLPHRPVPSYAVYPDYSLLRRFQVNSRCWAEISFGLDLDWTGYGLWQVCFYFGLALDCTMFHKCSIRTGFGLN